MLDESPDIVAASLCVVSDFQRVDWVQPARRVRNAEGGKRNEAGESPGVSSPLAPLAEWGAGERSLRVVLAAVGDREAVNRSVAGLDTAQWPFVAGTEGLSEVWIANPGDADLPGRDRTADAGAAGLPRGGSVLREAPGDPQAILIATGSEVQIALDAAKLLDDRGVAARVVSLPSWEIFDAQPASYRESVLPRGVRARVSVEAGPSTSRTGV